MSRFRKSSPAKAIVFLGLLSGFSTQACASQAWWQRPFQQWPTNDYFVKTGGGDYNLPVWMYAALWKAQGLDCLGDNSPRNAVYASINCTRTDGNTSSGFQIIFHHGPPNEFVVDSIVIDGQRRLTDVETDYFFHFFRRQIGNGNPSH